MKREQKYEISNKIPTMSMSNVTSNAYVDLSSFFNAQHLLSQSLENESHKLAQYPRGTRKEGDNRRKRGNCRHCPNTICGKRNARQTSYYCIQCGISLHPDCFHTYHNNLKKMKFPQNNSQNNTSTSSQQAAANDSVTSTTNDILSTH